MSLKNVENDAFIGVTLDNRYKVQSVLGRGGMGVVYRALDLQTDQPRAIKMLHAHKVADSEALKRFNREARTVAQVKHHHIVTLYHFGMSSTRQPFLVMDYIEGQSLKDELAEHGPFSFDRAQKIFSQVLDALQCAHDKDVVHRDLKPENIILTKDGEDRDWVKLVDFGLSKLKDNDPENEDIYHITKAGDVCGSPPYMSPEQCLSNSIVDPRSDIYSMGIVVYEVLSGRLPYQAKSAIEMIDCHLYGSPTPFSDIAPELRGCNETTYVLKKALAKEPDNRHQSCAEFSKELNDALRRDWPKVRSYRFRLEDAVYQDLASEAIALETGEHPTLDLSHYAQQHSGSPVKDVINELNTKTQETDVAKDDHEDGYSEENQSLVHKILSIFSKKDKGDENYGYVDENEIGYSSCPFCNSPVKARLRFCVNCQRQLPSVEEFSKLRATSGRYAFSRTHIRESHTAEKRGFSARTKMRMARPGMSLFQKFMTLCLIVVVLYALYAASKDKHVVQQIQRIVATLKS